MIKPVDVLLKVGNPVGYIFEKGIDLAFPDKEDGVPFKHHLKTGFNFIGNPIVFGIEKAGAAVAKQTADGVEKMA